MLATAIRLTTSVPATTLVAVKLHVTTSVVIIS